MQFSHLMLLMKRLRKDLMCRECQAEITEQDLRIDKVTKDSCTLTATCSQCKADMGIQVKGRSYASRPRKHTQALSHNAIKDLEGQLKTCKNVQELFAE